MAAETGGIVGSITTRLAAGIDLAAAPVPAVAVAARVHEDHSAEQADVESDRRRDDTGDHEAAHDQGADEPRQQPPRSGRSRGLAGAARGREGRSRRVVGGMMRVCVHDRLVSNANGVDGCRGRRAATNR